MFAAICARKGIVVEDGKRSSPEGLTAPARLRAEKYFANAHAAGKNDFLCFAAAAAKRK